MHLIVYLVYLYCDSNVYVDVTVLPTCLCNLCKLCIVINEHNTRIRMCVYPHTQHTYVSMHAYTVLPQIMARAFISFQQLFTPATK